jgi:hypothetical protein
MTPQERFEHELAHLKKTGKVTKSERRWLKARRRSRRNQDKTGSGGSANG